MHSIPRRVAAAAAGITTLVGITLASAGSAGAATVGQHFNDSQVAYQILSSFQFNGNRAVFTIKPHSDVAYGVGLQATVDGGTTVVLAAVPEGGNYVLKAITTSGGQDITNTQPGTPFGPGTVFSTIHSSDSATGILFSQATGGIVYLDVRESTAHNLVNYIEGQGTSAETSAATLGTIVHNVHTKFHAPFNGSVALGPVTAHAIKAVITRSGVTTPAGVNPMGITAGKRITFDAFPVDETQDTVTGTSSGTLVLAASPALPGVGSTWTIVAP